MVHNIVAELPNSAITPEMYGLPFWGKSPYNAKYINRDEGITASKTVYIAFTAAYNAYTACRVACIPTYIATWQERVLFVGISPIIIFVKGKEEDESAKDSFPGRQKLQNLLPVCPRSIH